VTGISKKHLMGFEINSNNFISKFVLTIKLLLIEKIVKVKPFADCTPA
jgi:hypothetical protein